MTKTTNVNVTIGGSISSILFVVFLVLKLCNVITWSWWWITAPLWIPLALFIIVTIISLIVGLIAYLCD